MNTQVSVTKKLRALPLLLFALFHAQGQEAFGSNFWQLPDAVRPATSETEKQHFVELIENVLSAFQPAAAKHNATFSYEVNWDSSGAGAFTLRRNGGHAHQRDQQEASVFPSLRQSKLLE